MTQRLGLALVISLVLWVTTTIPSNAGILIVTGGITGNGALVGAGLLSLVASHFVFNITRKHYLVTVDPTDIESFELDMSYDPQRVQYIGVTYVSPYAELGSGGPDLSTPGLIQGIAGQSETDPPTGEADIFTVEFDDLQPLSNDPTSFTVFATGDDYLSGFDASTGLPVIATSDAIVPAIAIAVDVPEPASLALLGASVIGLGLIRRCWSQNCAIASTRQRSRRFPGDINVAKCPVRWPSCHIVRSWGKSRPEGLK